MSPHFTVKRTIVNKLGIQTTYSVLKQSREHLLQYEPKSINDLPPRSMQDSFTSALIPLSTDIKMQDKYVTFLGSVRLGRLMEDMDMFAVWVVHQHIQIPNLDPSIPLPYTFVTLLVDKISFTDIIPKVFANSLLDSCVCVLTHTFILFFIVDCSIAWPWHTFIGPRQLGGSQFRWSCCLVGAEDCRPMAKIDQSTVRDCMSQRNKYAIGTRQSIKTGNGRRTANLWRWWT